MFQKSYFVQENDVIVEMTHSELYSKVNALYTLENFEELNNNDNEEEIAKEVVNQLFNKDVKPELIGTYRITTGLRIIYKFDDINFPLDVLRTDSEFVNNLEKIKGIFNRALKLSFKGSQRMSGTHNLGDTQTILNISTPRGSAQRLFNAINDVIEQISNDGDYPQLQYKSKQGLYMMVELVYRNGKLNLRKEDVYFTLSRETLYNSISRIGAEGDFTKTGRDLIMSRDTEPSIQVSSMRMGNHSNYKRIALPNIYQGIIPHTCFGRNSNNLSVFNPDTSGYGIIQQFFSGRFNSDISYCVSSTGSLKHFVNDAYFKMVDKTRLGTLNLTPQYLEKSNDLRMVLNEIIDTTNTQLKNEAYSELNSLVQQSSTRRFIEHTPITLSNSEGKIRELIELNNFTISLQSYLAILISSLFFSEIDSLYENKLTDAFREKCLEMLDSVENSN